MAEYWVIINVNASLNRTSKKVERTPSYGSPGDAYDKVPFGHPSLAPPMFVGIASQPLSHLRLKITMGKLNEISAATAS